MAKLKQKSKRSKKQSTAEAPILSLKEQLAEKRKAAEARKSLIRTLTTAATVSIFVGLFVGIVGGVKGAIGGILGVLCLLLSFKYPRQALYAFIIYVPLGGTITYMLGSSPLMQLAKDAFYIPVFISIMQYCRQNQLPMIIPKAIKTPLTILLVLCIMTLLFVNGSQQFTGPKGEQPILMGILGFKVLLGYLPLITCAYYLVRKKQDLLFLTRLQIGLTLLCCGLAFIQYMLLQKGVCQGTSGAVGDALFKASLDARCFVGGALLYSPEEGVIRLPGTFVAPWQWGWFLIASSFFTFASAFSDPSFIWRIISLGSMAAVFIMSVISGQRIALGIVPVVFVILLFLTGQIANLKRFIPIGVGLAFILGIAMITNPAVVQERMDSFTGRWSASPPQEFIVSQFTFVQKGQKGFLGNGLGRATNSARSLGSGILIETYYPKLLHEIGPLGMFAFLALVTALTFATFKAYRSVKNRSLRSYGASFWVFILFISYNTYYYPLDVDPVAVYYWLFAGIILKLPELDRQEKELEKPEEQRKKKPMRKAKDF